MHQWAAWGRGAAPTPGTMARGRGPSSRCPFSSLLSVFPARAWYLWRGGQGRSLNQDQVCPAVGSRGAVPSWAPVCWPVSRVEAAEKKLKIGSGQPTWRKAVGGQSPWTGFWRSPGCQAGRRWRTETQSRLRAHSCQVLEALDRDTAGGSWGRTWGGDCHLGKKTQCGQMLTFKPDVALGTPVCNCRSRSAVLNVWSPDGHPGAVRNARSRAPP